MQSYITITWSGCQRQVILIVNYYSSKMIGITQYHPGFLLDQSGWQPFCIQAFLLARSNWLSHFCWALQLDQLVQESFCICALLLACLVLIAYLLWDILLDCSAQMSYLLNQYYWSIKFDRTTSFKRANRPVWFYCITFF